MSGLAFFLSKLYVSAEQDPSSLAEESKMFCLGSHLRFRDYWTAALFRTASEQALNPSKIALHQRFLSSSFSKLYASANVSILPELLEQDPSSMADECQMFCLALTSTFYLPIC